jgi:hypothetical protein
MRILNWRLPIFTQFAGLSGQMQGFFVGQLQLKFGVGRAAAYRCLSEASA